MQVEIKKLVYTSRKGFCLRIDDNGNLIVFAPHNATERDIYQIVQNKSQWIIKTRERILQNQKKLKPINFEQGDNLLFLGKTYQLVFSTTNSKVELDEVNQKIVVPFAEKSTIKNKILRFYRNNAESIFRKFLDKWAERMNVRYSLLRIKDSKTLWGSCGKNGSINLNWRLILLPEELIEHIIIHELAHIVYRNHSKQFYNFISLFSKNYKEKDRWLRENSYILQLFR